MAGVLDGLIGLSSLRATFFGRAGFGLALPRLFLRIGLAMVRFAAFRRPGLMDLRALPRAADFPFRSVARFFRLAMIPSRVSIRKNIAYSIC